MERFACMFNKVQPCPVPIGYPAPLRAAGDVAALAFSLAEARDVDGATPDAEIAMLADKGLLLAPLPPSSGGNSLGTVAQTAPILRDVLRTIGGGPLSLGRLYEGHVNAARLVLRYGTGQQLNLLAQEAAKGRLSAVWNAQTGAGLQLDNGVLQGTKIYTSGSGIVRRPVLTAMRHDGLVMVMPDVGAACGDMDDWRPLGMRASLTGKMDFSGIPVADSEVIGAPGDYYRAPLFAGGAWRVLAVQQGALERLMMLYRRQLVDRGRCDDAVQRARFGEAAARLETARLWTARTALLAEDANIQAADIDALVNFARTEFEVAALAIIERIERGLGLSVMLRPNPIERIIRDLRTYLRQPFPDAALATAAGWALQDRPIHGAIGEY
ncbi:MAG: acyl-CoA/acyl-ACP dehydrogenase [Acetobacteraceae bacterium]|nr:acyl-CoA/acyl-ACP dehydrogenase [Acetobacteraceae bacterium]